MRGFNHPSNSCLPFTPKQRKLPIIHIFIKLFILLGHMQMNCAEILADQKEEKVKKNAGAALMEKE